MLTPYHRLYLALLPRMLLRLRWRIVFNTLKYFLRIGRVRRGGPDVLTFKPISATIWVTGRCNKSCHFCYYQSELNAAQARDMELTHERFLELLDLPEIRGAARVCLYGGEPLLNGELPAMIRSAKRRGHLVTINTNGLLINKHLDALRRDPPDLLSISYYPEDAAAIEEGIELAAPHMPVMIIYVLSRSRLDHVEAVVQSAVRNKVRAVCLGLFNPVGIEDFVAEGQAGSHGGPGWPRDMVPVGPDTPPAAADRIDPFLGEVPLRGDEPELKSLVRELRGKYGRHVALVGSGACDCETAADTTAPATCRAFWSTVSVDALGRVSPCCQFPVSAFAESILTTPSHWNAERMIYLRRNMRQGMVPGPCAQCSFLRDDAIGL